MRVIKSKLTTGSSGRKRRLKVATYGLGALLFLAWVAEALFSSTKLVSNVPIFWSVSIVMACGLVGAAVGYTLSAGKWRSPSVTTKKAGTMLSTFIFALLYCAIGDSLAERVTNSITFWGRNVDTHISVQPVRVVGIGRGAKRYVELAGFGPTRFAISRLDFKILAASTRDHASLRYCLPVVTERVGDAMRVLLPDVPRPTLSEQVGAIVECKSGISPPTLIS